MTTGSIFVYFGISAKTSAIPGSEIAELNAASSSNTTVATATYGESAAPKLNSISTASFHTPFFLKGHNGL